MRLPAVFAIHYLKIFKRKIVANTNGFLSNCQIANEDRYNVKKYLYDKREAPYEQFISIIYTILEDTKKL